LTISFGVIAPILIGILAAIALNYFVTPIFRAEISLALLKKAVPL
jgi:hypothetical protein